MTISFKKPANLNGQKLIEELETAGIIVGNDKPFSKWPIIDAENLLWLEIDKQNMTQAEIIINAHNG